jgi:hypothetical protein
LALGVCPRKMSRSRCVEEGKWRKGQGGKC